jgi:hypothetical protein
MGRSACQNANLIEFLPIGIAPSVVHSNCQQSSGALFFQLCFGQEHSGRGRFFLPRERQILGEMPVCEQIRLLSATDK